MQKINLETKRKKGGEHQIMYSPTRLLKDFEHNSKSQKELLPDFHRG